MPSIYYPIEDYNYQEFYQDEKYNLIKYANKFANQLWKKYKNQFRNRVEEDFVCIYENPESESTLQIVNLKKFIINQILKNDRNLKEFMLYKLNCNFYGLERLIDNSEHDQDLTPLQDYKANILDWVDSLIRDTIDDINGTYDYLEGFLEYINVYIMFKQLKNFSDADFDLSIRRIKYLENKYGYNTEKFQIELEKTYKSFNKNKENSKKWKSSDKILKWEKFQHHSFESNWYKHISDKKEVLCYVCGCLYTHLEAKTLSHSLRRCPFCYVEETKELKK